MITINTADDLLKYTQNQILEGIIPVSKDEILVRCLFDELKRRSKRRVKKRSVNHYGDYVWYIAFDGRLARVPNTGKNPLGTRLVKNKKLYTDETGLLRAKEEIPSGTYVKIRPLLNELDPKDRWSTTVKNRIAEYLDGGESCKMIIDRDFETAYRPSYREDFCLEGDLVTGHSCMSEEGSAAQEFYGGIDGCYVCRFENGEGEQVGRCIMYEYKGMRHFIRIYAKRDYARCALRLLRAEMRESDIFGRSEIISGMRLPVNWDYSNDRTMYLDGEYYGLNVRDRCIVAEDYDVDLKTTSNEYIEEYLGDCDWTCCESCGEWSPKDDMIRIGDKWYCDEDCAANDGCVECAYCGEWETSDENGYYTPDGDWVCCKNCLQSEGYTTCDECGEVISIDDAFEVNGDYFCDEECAKSSGWEQCSVCGEWYRGLYTIGNTDRKICSSCANNKNMRLAWTKIRKTNKGANND